MKKVIYVVLFLLIMSIGTTLSSHAISATGSVTGTGLSIETETLDEVLEAKKERISGLSKTYKKAFKTRLGKKLNKILSAKLKNILVKIDRVSERIESNTKITETKKEKTLAQLDAIKELIEENLEERSTINSDLQRLGD